MEPEHDKTAGRVPANGKVLPSLAVSGLAVSLLAGIALILAGFGTRIGIWNFPTGFAILKYGAWGGLAGLLISLASALLSIRNRHFAAALVSIIGMFLGVMAFGKPLLWKMAANQAPPIHDITTDIVNPPGFVAILPLRAGAPNPAEYGGTEVAVRQRQGYPEIKTMIVSAPRDQAFNRALETARSMGWDIIATVPEEGRIEATDSTFWFGFKDDIVIRVTPAGYRSMVDIRSVSRVGTSDLGTNAKRIRDFLKVLAKKG